MVPLGDLAGLVRIPEKKLGNRGEGFFRAGREGHDARLVHFPCQIFRYGGGGFFSLPRPGAALGHEKKGAARQGQRKGEENRPREVETPLPPVHFLFLFLSRCFWTAETTSSTAMLSMGSCRPHAPRLQSPQSTFLGRK